jgi:hypothetical protein
MIDTHLCVPNIGTLALVNISFGMYLTHIVFINSLVKVNVPFEMHQLVAPHVPIGTLVMVYVSMKHT